MVESAERRWCGRSSARRDRYTFLFFRSIIFTRYVHVYWLNFPHALNLVQLSIFYMNKKKKKHFESRTKIFVVHLVENARKENAKSGTRVLSVLFGFYSFLTVSDNSYSCRIEYLRSFRASALLWSTLVMEFMRKLDNTQWENLTIGEESPGRILELLLCQAQNWRVGSNRERLPERLSRSSEKRYAKNEEVVELCNFLCYFAQVYYMLLIVFIWHLIITVVQIRTKYHLYATKRATLAHYTLICNRVQNVWNLFARIYSQNLP